MKLKADIDKKNITATILNNKIVDKSGYGLAALTHYSHNRKNGVSKVYKREAVNVMKHALQYECPEASISQKVAEDYLQYCLVDFTKDKTIPFVSPDKPRFYFIDLFAGVGGFRIALQNMGGKCVFTSEWDVAAQKTYSANFGEVPFGDITKEQTKKFIPDGFDVLCAGFPCQAFSIAGRRGGFADIRGTLFFDVAEILKRKRPRAFLLENVKGLVGHDKGKTLDTILNVLRNDLGYFVPEPKILNAKDFGLPQNRERIFIVGFRDDTGVREFEYPTKNKKKKVFGDIKESKPVEAKYYLSTQYFKTLRKHKERHESKGNGFGYEIIADNQTANAIVVGGMGRERNLVYDDRLVDFTPTTKIKGEINREGIRRMTPREWARLQGFPDKFRIVVADAQAYKQFGNSVPVPVVEAVADKVIRLIVK